MRKHFWTLSVILLCLAVVLCGCNKKPAKEPDNTVGGVMGDVYIVATAEDMQVSGKQVSQLQTDITLAQPKYANVYEVSGTLHYQHDFSSYSSDELLKNGFYLSFDLCAPADAKIADAVVTVKSGAEGTERSFSGADFKDNKLTVTERIISEDGESYESIAVTFDLDGAGDKYFAEVYTLDLSGVEATLRTFMFGEWPMTYYYQQVTLEEFIEKGQKLVVSADYAGLGVASAAATIDMYELFLNPLDPNDLEFTTYSTSKTVNSYLGGRTYDMIFLQSGRYHTLRFDANHQGNMISATKLCRIAAEKNKNVRAVIIAPYGAQVRYDVFESGIYGPVANHSEHVAQINKEADETAKAIADSRCLTDGAVSVAYVGNAFEGYSSDPAIVQADLFGVADGLSGFASNRNKASLAGAYLMAATVYTSVFDASPIGLDVYGPAYAELDSSLKGGDGKLAETLKKYDITAEEMALRLQTVAYASVGGKAEGEQKYTVYFNSNGGSEVEPITATLGTELTAPADPVRAGYVFKGWFEDKALVQVYEFYRNYMPLGGTTLYARWEKAGDTSYTVEHYTQGTDGSYSLFKTDSDRVSVADNTVYGTLMGVQGYVYNPTHPDGRASAIVSADGRAKIKLYYDRAEYNIVYEYGEDYTNVSALPDEHTAKYGDTVKLAPKPSMNGKIFVGWASGDTLVGDTSFTMPASDVTLYGYWFDAEGCPTIAAATGSVYGKDVSEIQENIKVNGLTVNGNLKYVSKYTEYMDQQPEVENMEMSEYAQFKYAYGNYIALNFKWPAAATDNAVISFVSGTDPRSIKKSGDDFTIALRVTEDVDNIVFTIDLDGNGGKDAQTYQIELSGVTPERAPGFEALKAVAEAYDARGSQLQYETYSMGKTSTGSGFGEYRHDDGGVAEVGTWQYIMHLDCTRWTYALSKNTVGYDFNNLDDPTTQIKLKEAQAYAYEVNGKESAAYQQMINEEYRSVLQPGDIVAYLYGNEGSGHVMVYVGDNTLMHCGGNSFRDGVRNSTLTGKPYDMDDVGGGIKIDSLDIVFTPTHANALFSTRSPKYYIAILRPLMMEEAEVTSYAKLHETYPNLYIEKTTSHPQGFAAQIGEEVEFTISFDNRGAEDVVLNVENLIPEGASIVKGNATETVKINSFDTKVIHVTYRVEETVTAWMEENGYNYLTFDTKVNDALINPLYLSINKMLTPEQEAKVQALDLSTLTATNDFDLMVEFYQKALGYDLTQKLEGCTDLSSMMKKLFDAHLTSDYMTMNYDLSGATGELMSLNPAGMYGGSRVRSTGTDDHFYRVKRLTDKCFAIGDIIVYSGSAANKADKFSENAGMFIYLGNDIFIHYNDGIELVRANGINNTILTYGGSKVYATDKLAELCGAATFVVLRPAQVME